MHSGLDLAYIPKRSAGLRHRGIAESLPDPREMSLDQRIEYLGPDEMLEVTPESLRIRKNDLRHNARKKRIKKSKNGLAA